MERVYDAVGHLRMARKNGATEEGLIETITHLAFYAGWPQAMSAMGVAQQAFRGSHLDSDITRST